MNFTDKEILQSFQESNGNNRKVLEFLYHKTLPKVQHYVLVNSGSHDDAFDVFQDAMVAFCKYVKQNKFDEKYSVDGFIYTVAKNIWINKVRKNKKLVLTEIADFSETTADSQNVLNYMISQEREVLVKKLFGMLGEKCRELLQLSIYQELSCKEICEKMGYANENGVKTQKYKCKQKLLQIVEQQKTWLLEN